MNLTDKINEGIIDLQERKSKMTEKNIQVLENVKEILLLGKTELCTVSMAADYFEVPERTLSDCITSNKIELEENGLKVYKRSEIIEIFSEVPDVILDKGKYKDIIKIQNMILEISNRGLRFMTKETMCYIGLILRDSPIAIEYRRKLGLINNPCPRKEVDFIEQLEETLRPFNIKGVKQFKILNYRVDYYIMDYNLAIEYDENEHKDYNQEKENKREEEIKKELFDEITNIPCRIIRVNDKNSNGYNCGLIIKEILTLDKRSDVIFKQVEILDKVKNILANDRKYSLKELSDIFEVSEMDIFKIIPKNKNITKKEVYELSLELTNSNVAKELRKRLLDISLLENK